MSLQLQRLELQITNASNPQQVGELAARRAIVLARLGRFAEAQTDAKRLRELHGDGSSGRIHVWIMLAEALTDWFSALSPLALDRVTRVQVLSRAMRYDELAAISSAWKAHLQFDMSDFDGMYQSLALAASHSSAANDDANARIAIILCTAYSLCGLQEQAQLWFARGRRSALAAGDQASIEALQHNRAALAFACLRLESCRGPVTPERLRTIRSELNSSKNLQALTKIQTLTNQLRLCEARLLVLEGQHAEAIAMFEAVRIQSPFAGYHFSQSEIDVELAYCKFRMGEIDRAADLIAAIEFDAFDGLDIDDQVLIHHLRLQMAKTDERFGNESVIHARFSELQDACVASHRALAAGLDAVTRQAQMAKIFGLQ